ncbi:hypothetical protein [Solilutibacter silvestris]|uniref:hypothetical protein n=1 Tax=Solilutibacter silvestris TaxID=1645665 RepID=UPI003D340D14
MMKKMLARAGVLLLVAGMALPAFAAKHMQPAKDQDPKPAPGKALLVIARPSSYGAAIMSSVYDAPDTGTEFIGILGGHDKIAYQAEPGKHRFMVIGENADFMDADLEAGKVYYAVVRARPGMWKARFSLLPIHAKSADKYNLESPDFKDWVKNSGWIEQDPTAQAWYAESKADIEEKKADYLKKWNVMAPNDRAELYLHAEDGTAP